jgi:toxin ParE1/3/4
MGRVERTTLAVEDTLQIWQYIAKDNVDAADRMIDRIGETLRLLSRHPRLGISVTQYRPGLFRFTVGEYLLFYEPIAKGIRLLRVLHSSRRMEDLL